MGEREIRPGLFEACVPAEPYGDPFPSPMIEVSLDVAAEALKQLVALRALEAEMRERAAIVAFLRARADDFESPFPLRIVAAEIEMGVHVGR